MVARAPRGWPVVFVSIWAVLAIAFLALPWSVETKSLALLHGLCAQQPTHSFYFGDQRLPFDARMTGIYGGVAMTSLALLALGRWRTGGLPSRGIILALVGGIAALAFDGVNSTLVDAGLAHLYQPQNILRLVTGLLTGTALAVFVWLLIGNIAFAPSARRPGRVVAGWRDIGWIMLAHAGVAAVVLTTWGPLRVPLSMLLMISAIAVLSGLMLGFVLLLGRRENRARTTADLAGAATLALVVALLLIGSLAGGRFLLEAWLGLPVQG
ncbi:MAG: DUF2085 domain-containing protein [Thermomicrobiales bacterium]|nr:DUF2085 domain-containing protein [Thermomicrobiales bacterium]